MISCPLQTRVLNATRPIEASDWLNLRECRKDCAWYDIKNEKCAILVIAQNITGK